MNDNDVIKELERALKTDEDLINRQHNLINHQQAEIERLEALSERLGNDIDLKLKYIYELGEKAKPPNPKPEKSLRKNLKNALLFISLEIKAMNMLKVLPML